jgi:putative transposase
LQEESYTSQTCPMCNTKNKTDNRNYTCRECGFTYHRDGVGAVNIYKKYLGLDQVEGGLTPPTGIRYKPDLCCHSEWNTSPFKKAG